MPDRANEITSGKFTLYPSFNNFVVEYDGESLEAPPAEADKLIEILLAVSGMQSFRALPPQVTEKPFTIKLNEEGACLLTREDEEKGITFPIYNIDELVDGIQKVVKKIQDLTSIRGGPRPGVKAWNTQEPPTDGRF
jgi:hypothetical protein